MQFFIRNKRLSGDAEKSIAADVRRDRFDARELAWPMEDDGAPYLQSPPPSAIPSVPARRPVNRKNFRYHSSGTIAHTTNDIGARRSCLSYEGIHGLDAANPLKTSDGTMDALN